MLRMKKHLILPLLSIGIGLNAMPASAEIICKSSEAAFLSGISWDVETGGARIKLSDNSIYTGKVVHSRPHSDYGDKLNILIPVEHDIFSMDHAEFITFRTDATSNYRVLGAGFITVDGERRIDLSFSSTTYDCIEM
ncbi:hypothetical protein VRRI112168_02750 [Vreelandella rituensis]|uniref:Uncharacterized protein n=2 Tax=Vreelandella rituensis TaxID=2282306 RepID=A0A368UD73_9GAMM|nr:hypothetical protein DU506_00470 [Halomonas rituensis]